MSEVRPTGIPKAAIGGDARDSERKTATVQSGESRLADVARRLNLDLKALIEANPQIQDLQGLKAGQDVFLPSGRKGHLPEERSEGTTAEQMPPSFSPLAGDPLAKSLAQLRLNQNVSSPSPGPDLSTPDRNIMFVDDGKTAAPAPGKATIASVSGKVPSDVEAVLARGAATKGAEAEFSAAQKALASGDYKAAYAEMEKLLRKQGEEVLSEPDVKAAQTVRDQLEFLSKLQAAGIKADYPPTEAQLVAYFKTLARDPGAARQAFRDYVNNFHVHPSDVPGAKSDVVYSKDKSGGTAVPDSWPEVANRPVSGTPQNTGKQMNDCEGYAFIAEKLLGAAGFKVTHHVTVHPGPNDTNHSMVMFTHPLAQGVTLTSNNGVFEGKVPRQVAREGFKYAAGEAAGQEQYYTGRTMAESQQETIRKDNKL